MPQFEPDLDQRIWQVVALIPPGRVATYGQVARLAGLGAAARRVGRAMRRLPPDSTIPWHRVLNASGRSSLPVAEGGKLQCARLAAEGVEFRPGGTVDLRRFGWNARA